MPKGYVHQILSQTVEVNSWSTLHTAEGAFLLSQENLHHIHANYIGSMWHFCGFYTFIPPF